jgi:hypothetical protein
MCDSREVLAKHLGPVERQSPVLAQHIRVALRSHGPEPGAKLKLYRDLDGIPLPRGSITYEQVMGVPQSRLLSATNCHNGQRKLALSLLEFLAVALEALAGREGVRQEDMVLVYAGASGMASVIAAQVFKGVRFLLYDPAPNTVELMPKHFSDKLVLKDAATAQAELGARGLQHQITVLTAEAGWFTDSTVPWLRDRLLPRCGRGARPPCVLFVSDIRADASREELIVQDMLAQQRWIVGLAPAAYMVKFRIPYGSNLDGILTQYQRAADALLQLPPRPLKPSSSHAEPLLPYLDGKLYIQLYARQRTAELRLVGFIQLYAPPAPTAVVPSRRKKGGGGGTTGDLRPAGRWYDLRDLEARMAVFNAVYRPHALFRFDHSETYQTRHDYESVSEYCVLRGCAAGVLGRRRREEIEALQRSIDAAMSQHISKDHDTCPFTSAIAALSRNLDAEAWAHVRACLVRQASLQPGSQKMRRLLQALDALPQRHGR